MMAVVPELFHRFARNFGAIFSGRNLLWHVVAIGLTIGIVTAGGDWAYYRWTRAETFFVLARPALGLGMFMPVLGSLAILVAGWPRRNRRLITTAWALGQAALLAYLITSCYKAITGRRPPPFHGHVGTFALNGPALTDSSHGFQFGFLKGGIFWGWPSGHTTVAFSMAICLTMLYPRNKIRCLLRVALRVLRRACRFGDHPLVIRIRGRSNHRRRDRKDGWQKFQIFKYRLKDLRVKRSSGNDQGAVGGEERGGGLGEDLLQ